MLDFASHGILSSRSKLKIVCVLDFQEIILGKTDLEFQISKLLPPGDLSERIVGSGPKPAGSRTYVLAMHFEEHNLNLIFCWKEGGW